MKKEKVPNIWKDKENYYLKVLNNNWYKLLIKLENLISVETMKFYQKKGIITLHLPVTTGSISSPMGRGSDSLPVKINLEGVNTYLADSMQFLLEYGCRLSDTGVYYIMPSFRGEKAAGLRQLLPGSHGDHGRPVHRLFQKKGRDPLS